LQSDPYYTFNPKNLLKPPMKIASLPINEALRIKDLQSYNILDTEQEKDYDGLVELASQICDCPIALITFVDKERQWFKASTQLQEKETARDIAFCSHTILQNEVMVVKDAKTDERFFDNPLVTGELQLRFYAGAPIVSSAGHNLGTVCVADTIKKNDLTEKQKNALTIIAGQVANLLELRARNYTIIKQAEARIEAEKKISQLIIAESDKKDKVVAYELAENLAQTLSATKFLLESADDPKYLQPGFLDKSVKTISFIVNELTNLSKSLIPTTFQHDDYYSLIHDYAMTFGKENNIKISFGEPEVLKSSHSNIGLNLFKIIQNQLEVSRLGGAKEIYITIKADKEIVLYFRDDTSNKRAGSSSLQFLNNITTRVNLVNGELTQKCSKGNNSIIIKMPLAGKVNHAQQEMDLEIAV